MESKCGPTSGEFTLSVANRLLFKQGDKPRFKAADWKAVTLTGTRAPTANSPLGPADGGAGEPVCYCVSEQCSNHVSSSRGRWEMCAEEWQRRSHGPTTGYVPNNGSLQSSCHTESQNLCKSSTYLRRWICTVTNMEKNRDAAHLGD